MNTIFRFFSVPNFNQQLDKRWISKFHWSLFKARALDFALKSLLYYTAFLWKQNRQASLFDS